MDDKTSKNRVLSIIRWVARIGGVAYLAFFLLFFIGETISPSQETNPMTFSEMVGMAFVFAYFAGLVLAWKWEGPGALIAIGGAIAFSVTIQEYSLLVVIMVAPGLLFLVCWLISRGLRETKETV